MLLKVPTNKAPTSKGTSPYKTRQNNADPSVPPPPSTSSGNVLASYLYVLLVDSCVVNISVVLCIVYV